MSRMYRPDWSPPEGARIGPPAGHPRAMRGSVYLSPVRPARNRQPLRGRPPMDTGLVTREQDRLLGELFTFLRIPSISTLPANAGDCRRAADWLHGRVHAARVLQASSCSRGRASDGVGREPAGPGQADGAGATATTTSSRPIRSTSGCPRRSSRPSATATSTPAAPSTTRARSSALLKAYRGGARRRTASRRSTSTSSSRARRSAAASDRRPPDARSRSGPAADAVLVGGHGVLRARACPAVYTALRGLCYAEIHLRTLERDLHSGTYGGVAPERARGAVPTAVRPQGPRTGGSTSPALRRGRCRPPQGGAAGLEGAALQREGVPEGRGDGARRSPGSRSTPCSNGSGRCRPSRSTASWAASPATAPRP